MGAPISRGEDELSMKQHKEWLQNEFMRKQHDAKKLEDRMALTFPDRRRLMNKKVLLTEVKAEYPVLFNFKQVICALIIIITIIINSKTSGMLIQIGE